MERIEKSLLKELSQNGIVVVDTDCAKMRRRFDVAHILHGEGKLSHIETFTLRFISGPVTVSKFGVPK